MYPTPSIDLSCSHCGAPRVYQLVPLEDRPTEDQARRLPHKIASIDLTCSRCGSNQTYKIVPDSVVHPITNRPKAATSA